MNTNTNYKILKHIKGHTAVYSEIPFTKEEQRDFLSKNYLLLDNSKDNPILAYNNPYYDNQIPLGAINQYGYPNNKYTKETKPLHTLLWKLLLNEPFHISFRYFDFHTNITPIQSIKDFTQYALSNGIRVQLHDLILDYKITLQPVQSNGQMQSAYWEQLNNQLSEYNELLKEHYQLRQLESYKPVTLQYYLGPDADSALDYILTWAPAYELDINFPTSEPQTYQVRHKGNQYYGIKPYITTHKDHFNDPKYYSKDIALLYTQLKYYEQIQEPITNPTQILCECGRPMSTYDQSAIAPTSVYYEALGNSGYYLEKAYQVTCQHCFNTYIYDIENDEYELITEDYKENLTIISKLDDPKNTTETDDWWNRPLQPTDPQTTTIFHKDGSYTVTKNHSIDNPNNTTKKAADWWNRPLPTNTPVKTILPDMDIFMEILQAMQETYPTLTLRQAIEKTNMHYWAFYDNKTA